MLKKVAIAQAFRLAFPDEMGSLPYTAEEMPVQHETLDKGPVQVVETKREPVKETKKETAGAPPEPTDSPSSDSDPAGLRSRRDIADMAETGQAADDRGAEEGARSRISGRSRWSSRLQPPTSTTRTSKSSFSRSESHAGKSKGKRVFVSAKIRPSVA